ncbi:hypothetical protein BCON_0255g00040 [Botryotinia convoluta]|uniref:Uncharacterized protein n=1 Tax=Botryotinia convoluta TaxID=54673 RepID=A0A4Z1HG39_9HELO|nr:hypothetical protein BCON_0255g00040 [Botryotinia convoluta]
MSSRLLTSPIDLRRSKGHRTSHSASYPPQQLTEISSLKEKPLPAAPKASTGVLRRLIPRRRDSIALPRVVEGLNRGIERVRRHSLRAGAGLGLKSPATPKTINPETTPRSISISKSTTKPTTSSLLTSKIALKTATAEGGEEDK